MRGATHRWFTPRTALLLVFISLYLVPPMLALCGATTLWSALRRSEQRPRG